MMPNFQKRSSASEIMDDLNYSGAPMNQTLHELEVINRMLGGNTVTLNALKTLLLGYKQEQPIRIADLGCGRADILRLIMAWANKQDQAVSLIGIDANPYIIEVARNNIGDSKIDLLTMNVLSEEFRRLKFDIVIGTLFYHHFSDDELIGFFSSLKHQATIGFIINDIHRHPLAYFSISLLTKLFSKSLMVKYDAPLSVMRAFTRSDLTRILQQAGIQNFTIRWCWAFRWQVLVRIQAPQQRETENSRLYLPIRL